MNSHRAGARCRTSRPREGAALVGEVDHGGRTDDTHGDEAEGENGNGETTHHVVAPSVISVGKVKQESM